MARSPNPGDEFLLEPGITFLNHGSFGACPRPVFEAYQHWQRELERQPVDFIQRRLPGLLAEANERLAAYIGVRAEDVVFVRNATMGANIVAQSLDLAPDDEVLGTDHEYGACEKAWRYACRQTGARYVRQSIPLPLAHPDEVVEALWRGVTPRTRVIFFSHITSPTALIFPAAEVCRRAREAGILTMVDGAHAPGQLDLDLDALGADFYTANCHKWLCAPKGSGLLYARPEAQPLLKPLVVSWGWESEKPGPSPFQDLYRWTGTDDPSAYLAVPAAIAFQELNDWRSVRRRCHELASRTRARIHALSGTEPICPDSPAWFGQMVTARLPDDLNVTEVSKALWEQHRIEAPVGLRDGRAFTRISFQAYNSEADADRLVAALKTLLPQAKRHVAPA